MGLDLAGPPRQQMDQALQWTPEELLDIAERVCPECGGDLADGRDVVNDEEVDIIFCPTCQWLMATEEFDAQMETVAFREGEAGRA